MRHPSTTAAFVFLGLVSAGCGERIVQESFDLEGTVERVEGALGPAAVTLLPADTATTRVTVELQHSGPPPEYGVVLEGTTLYLTLLCGEQEVCDGSFTVFAPASVSANLNSSTGEVVIEGIDGVVTVTTDEGTVDLDRIGGSVDVYAGSGAVDLRGVGGAVAASSHDAEIKVASVEGDLDLSSQLGLLVGTDLMAAQGRAETDSGQVFLTWSASPDQVEVESVSGDVFLTVPAGPYQVIAGSTTGEVTVTGVSEEPGAASVLRVTTEFGNITITGV